MLVWDQMGTIWISLNELKVVSMDLLKIGLVEQKWWGGVGVMKCRSRTFADAV